MSIEEPISLLKLSEHWIVERAKGNTTRQVDEAIQLLFQGKEIKIEDHYQFGSSESANMNLFNRIAGRLYSEHGISIMDINKNKPGKFFIMSLTEEVLNRGKKEPV